MSQQLEIVIGCVPDQQESILKTVPGLGAAALYADRVTVITREADTLVELINTDGKEFYEQSWFRSYGADSTGDDVYKRVHEIRDLGVHRLGELLNAGVSENEIENDKELKALDDMADTAEIYAMVMLFEEYIESPEKLPLICDPNGELQSRGITTNFQTRSGKKKAQIAAQLGTGLQAKLPSYDKLHPEDILRLRLENESYLQPFRSYVVRLSSELESVSNSPDEWGDLINEVYIGKILPALKTLEKELENTSFIRSILKDLRENHKQFIGSSLTIGIGELSELPPALSIGSAISLDILTRILRNKYNRAELENDDVYFLYSLGRAALEN